ncbi:lysophospholipid acyltransferase family protein [Streptomyces sp. NPDC050535]|uniref:lysophospholipid acyltransferase family protein n=1 Tax=Streptomyces sp. NPDC050535 TaxID=3365626 RepID=UPI0037B69675
MSASRTGVMGATRNGVIAAGNGVIRASRVGVILRPRRDTTALVGPALTTAAFPAAPTKVPSPRRRAGVRPVTFRPVQQPTSAWLPSAPCTPRFCVDATGSRAGVPRAALRLATLLFVLTFGIVLIPVVGRIPAASRDRLIRTWCRTMVRAAGVRLRVTGSTPPAGGLLVVANHISWMDIPLLAAVRPGRMIAKAEIRQWPVAGALTASSGALFIERDRLRALPRTVTRIADTLRDGSTMVVFPEGSTWCGRAQGHFRRAVFQAALDAGVPVQPVRIHYRLDGGTDSTAPAFVGSDSLLTSVWRVVSARALVAELDLRPVLASEDYADRRDLARAAQGGLRSPGPHALPYGV